MTTNEVVKRKKEMETDFLAGLRTLEEDSGCTIARVEVERVKISYDRNILADIKIILEL